ncbi:transposase [Desulfofalx alkaliphila]|uniref:transposase n=1 Tax=Desulfofalx alkaliphila TaxID=105483 RepID=UPI0004E0AF9D|nr:transposase [Desulfofalx alkaliphila]
MEKLPRRKKIRLKGYDYSQAGYYFITICTQDKKATSGRQCSIPQLSKIGEIVDLEISKINSVYENVKVDKYVIMPNHIHMIIILYPGNGRSKTAPTISRIIQQFKGSISKKVGFSLWQKSFYDHIIRNKQEYLKIWDYIDTNPLKWEEDKYYI